MMLGYGACIKSNYIRNKPPNNTKTIIYSTIKSQHVREFFERKKIITIDFTLRMRWFDSEIKIDRKILENTKEISLTPLALSMIWIPDLHIRNRSSFQVGDEWRSMVNARIMPLDETIQAESNKGVETAGVELTYDIKTSVYCPFDYSYYPIDIQSCTVGFGSRARETNYRLYDRNQIFHNISNYKQGKFNV